MDDIQLLIDLHRHTDRQGPGGEAETLLAARLAGLDPSTRLQIADIGCGTGNATLLLARELNAHVTAVDLAPEFIDELRNKVEEQDLAGQITPRVASMNDLPFEDETFDVMWSEGAIYNMGFRKGIEAWRPFLRPGGVLAVSEITWLRPDPPREIRQHWNSEYPEIATAVEKIAILERAGYDLLGYLVLPPTCWVDHYYGPTETRMAAFLQRHAGRPEAAEVVAMERHEAELYRRYRDWFGYGFYVARKR